MVIRAATNCSSSLTNLPGYLTCNIIPVADGKSSCPEGKIFVLKTVQKRLSDVLVCVLLVAAAAILIAQTPKPKRINQAIELLAQRQPIYYTGSHSGTIGP